MQELKFTTISEPRERIVIVINGVKYAVSAGTSDTVYAYAVPEGVMVFNENPSTPYLGVGLWEADEGWHMLEGFWQEGKLSETFPGRNLFDMDAQGRHERVYNEYVCQITF